MPRPGSARIAARTGSIIALPDRERRGVRAQSAPKASDSRVDMIVMPWSPMKPDSRIASPGRARAPPMSMSVDHAHPVVVMNTPSPLPCSTTWCRG